MQANGLVLYLKVSPEMLVKRLQASPLNSRPLLKEKNELKLLSYLNQTLTTRAPFYEKAGIILEPGTVADTVAASLRLLNLAGKPT